MKRSSILYRFRRPDHAHGGLINALFLVRQEGGTGNLAALYYGESKKKPFPFG
jgi:hypothetical protein